MGQQEKQVALDRISANIKTSGWHIYAVEGSLTPQFCYTIGLFEKLELELVFAGGYFFSVDEIENIINRIADKITSDGLEGNRIIDLGDDGVFRLDHVDRSWSKELLLGAFDYYEKPDIPCLQIVPSQDEITLDVPDMTERWSPDTQNIWRDLKSDSWPFQIPQTSVAVTNLRALRGNPISEAVRWEDDYWEMFAGPGPDVDPKDAREVPIAILLNLDKDLHFVMKLDIGDGCWRDLSDPTNGQRENWKIWDN